MLALGLFFAGCAAHESIPQPGAREAYQVGDDVQLRRLTPRVWIHTTYDPKNGPANGVLVLGESDAFLIDTGWTPAQTERLLQWASAIAGHPVKEAAVTHSHSDRMGGISELLRRGIPVHALRETVGRATAAGLPPPSVPFDGEASVEIDGIPIELFFPGRGHAPDNIVAWIPSSGVLFGGCLVRPMEATTLGNTADADLASWAAAIRALQARYPAAVWVVPGHGEPGGAELLTHTLELLSPPAQGGRGGS